MLFFVHFSLLSIVEKSHNRRPPTKVKGRVAQQHALARMYQEFARMISALEIRPSVITTTSTKLKILVVFFIFALPFPVAIHVFSQYSILFARIPAYFA